MTKVINTKLIPTIFSTNEINEVEVNHDKKVESDSELREVIKKGYLLNNINLSTVPGIIKDAIDNAILDAKTQTLADDLIQTLKQSLENLDDGVYKKTYIDNIISYVENLVVSKVSPETVAAIADSRLTVALEGFATASNVSLLLSRVENSEAEIETVKQTINTKDSARTLQLEQMEVRVDETFAGYSDAIDLYVDSEGNVKSQKIETLSTNIGLQLQEVNQLIVDTNNEWNAKSIKLITSPSGAITGYSFQDGSGVKSNFDIYADNFKISNSYNTYSPFSIIGTSLYFNGKVTFSNVTGGESIVTKDNLQTVFNSNITTIDGGIITTNEAFINKLNATGGLIADTVTANEFVGKTFTGGVINGAVINGAVVKASYLDLDGELEVLTNYHITVAMYNANPSLYSDAVYLSGTSEYRIPSISIIREETKTQDISANGAIFNSKIRSYNCANVGHNLKCVKNITEFTSSSSIKILTISNPTQSASDPYTFSSNKVRIHIGAINIGLDVQYVYHHIPSNYDAESIGSPEVTEYYWLLNGSKINSITVNGFSFTVSGNELHLNAGTYNLLSNFTDTTSSLFKLENIGGWNVKWYGQEFTGAYATYFSSAQSINIAYMSTNLTINNMI